MPRNQDLKAEIAVYDALKKAFEDSKHGKPAVGHSLQVCALERPNGRVRRNEIDVVLAWRQEHDGEVRDHVAAIEVKSWKILRINGSRWIVGDGEKPDPFIQVENAAKTAAVFFENQINGSPIALNANQRRYNFLKLVAFPNLSRADLRGIGDLAQDAASRILFKEDIQDGARLRQRMLDAAQVRDTGSDLDKTRPLLERHCFTRHDPAKLAGVIKTVRDESVDGCSRRASSLLKIGNRVVVLGAAGTGKSVLAAEAARRIAADVSGLTLLLTFHEHLAQYLAEGLEQSSDGAEHNVIVGTPESVLPALGVSLAEVLEAADLNYRDDRYYLQRPEFYCAMAAAIDPASKISAVLVDEAQDFDQQALESMEDLVGQAGRLMVFADPLQRTRADVAFATWRPPLFDEDIFPDSNDPEVIDHNWRNTQSIGRWVADAVLGKFDKSERGDGYRSFRTELDDEMPVDVLAVSQGTEELIRTLKTVVEMYGESTELLTVLYDESRALPRAAKNTLDELGVLYQTIDAIRGLDADCVALVVPPLLEGAGVDLSAAYVGATRATGALHFLPFDPAPRS